MHNDIENNLFKKLNENFQKLNIKDILLKDFEKYSVDFYQKHKNKYDAQNLINYEPIDDLIKIVLDHYSEQTKNPNPLANLNKEKLKNHSFFKNKPYVCSAPWTTLRFGFDGKITVCCINDLYDLGFYPETKPIEAWFGKAIKILRDSLKNFDFSKGCQFCERFILNNTADISVIHLQEEIGLGKDVNKKYPSQLIFQLHNTCNFECIMCGGIYSSSIRKNRDGLPNFKNIYDENFLKQIEIFIKNTRIIEFIGGEPLLIPINYELMELIIKHNPECEVNVISNGSVYNNKIENIFKKLLNLKVHISLDSINPKTYSFIRRNGNLETIMLNIKNLKKINKMGSIAVCPLIQNIYEIHDIINFCKSIPTDIWFNTVESTLGLTMYDDVYETGLNKRPLQANPPKSCEKIPEFRLRYLSKEKKEDVIRYLKKEKHPNIYQNKIDGLIEYILSTV
jgi:MoaA/NifB/PqqE/SkfB family radical SAM enzyme